MERRHRGDVVRVARARLPDRAEEVDGRVHRDEPHHAVDLAQVALVAGHPRRDGRERGVGREAHRGQERDHRRIRPEQLPPEQPQAGRDGQRRDEVREVDDPVDVVEPVDRPVPEVLLQPDRRDGAEEHPLVEAQLRPGRGRSGTRPRSRGGGRRRTGRPRAAASRRAASRSRPRGPVAVKATSPSVSHRNEGVTGCRDAAHHAGGDESDEEGRGREDPQDLPPRSASGPRPRTRSRSPWPNTVERPAAAPGGQASNALCAFAN